MQKLIGKSIIGSGAALIGLIYIIAQRPSRQKIDAFFVDGSINHYDQIPPRIAKLLAVQYAVRGDNIPQAIHSMPKETAKDLYNLGTLKTIRAYKLIQEGQAETAGKVLQEATSNFQEAANKTHNPYLQSRIKNNISISKNIDILQNIQICFNDFGQLLDDLEQITNNITNIQKSIDEQIIAIQNKNISDTIGEECVNQITKMMKNTNITLEKTKNIITQEYQKYQDIYNQYVDNPAQCIGTNIKPLLQDTQKTQVELQELAGTYAMSWAAIQMRNQDILQQMCKQGQDDTLSNQSLENALQELIQNLEQSTQTDDTTGEKNNNNPQEEQKGPTSSSPQYIPLTQEEQKILQEIHTQNKQWIESMMQIRTKNYNPQKTIESIFQIFYPEMTEFTIPGW